METITMTPLGYRIQNHWMKYRPKMVAALRKEDQLEKAILAAQELTANLLYELTVIQKMDHHMAREIAMREWALLPDEEDQPELSFNPANLELNPTLPATSV
jgi:hypothetical protein